jgi:hypothetical protein
MAKCSVIKATGQLCKGDALPGKSYCWSHDPANSEARKRIASRAGKRGGRGRPAVDLSEIKSQLAGMLADVLTGRIPTNIAAVANQIQNSRLRVVEVERKLRETDELIERIEALEAAAQAQSSAPQTGSDYTGNGYKSLRGMTRQRALSVAWRDWNVKHRTDHAARGGIPTVSVWCCSFLWMQMPSNNLQMKSRRHALRVGATLLYCR